MSVTEPADPQPIDPEHAAVVPKPPQRITVTVYEFCYAVAAHGFIYDAVRIHDQDGGADVVEECPNGAFVFHLKAGPLRESPRELTVLPKYVRVEKFTALLEKPEPTPPGTLPPPAEYGDDPDPGFYGLDD